MLMGTWIDALLEWSKFLGYSWYLTMRTVLLQVFSLVLVFLVILWTAVFMYGTFYYAYMPQVAHERDVHLQFRTDCDAFQKKEQMCSFPSANFSLHKPNQAKFLTRGQSYVVSLELVMPESKINQEHGMFMTYLQFYTNNGIPVKSSVRSGMLRYKSWLYRAFETSLLLPTLFLGSTEERQVITTELFTDYQEDSYKPAVGVYIEVQSRNIEIYSAKMRIHARFAGLRYLLFHWPILSSFCGISVNMFFLCTVAILSWYQLKVDKYGENPDQPSVQPTAPPKVPQEEKHKRVRALLERERQKEREAVTRELTSTSSSPNLLHKRAASMDRPPQLIPAIDTLIADVRDRSYSAVTATDTAADTADDMQIRQRKSLGTDERVEFS